MRTLILMMATAALITGPAANAWAHSSTDQSKTAAAQQTARNYEFKGDLARARDENASAVAWYYAATRYDNHDAALFNKLGIAQLKTGEMSASRKSFTDAVKRDPNFVDALNNLGAVYCLQRRYKPAVKYLKMALALDETKATAHLNLAEAWMGQKQMERAMTEYARALELDADILSSTDKDGVFAQISTPEQQAMISFLIAKAYAKRGNTEGALDYLQRAKEEHYRELASVYTDPVFAALWKDPRLTAIVKR
ncbi:MAG: tetratricopeptide repeat protein [Acidobacteriaceae bacterium]